MITCVIIIKESPGKGVMVDMNPDQPEATPREMEIAGIIDRLMQPVSMQSLRQRDGTR